jgi:hypothetical protein
MSASHIETPVAATPTAANPTPPEAAPSGRDDAGRFAKGNPGGPGNPFARRTAAMRKAIQEAATAEDMAAITRKMIELAKEGDKQAAKLVFQYVAGKPTEPSNPDRVDIEEWGQFKEEAGMMQELPGIVGKPEPILPLTAVRGARPEMTAGMAQMMGAMCRDPEGFFGEYDKAKEAEFRREERAVLRHHHAKYGDVPPDETGLPPGVRPLRPKDNGKNGGKRRDRGGRGVSSTNVRIGEPPRVCQHPPRAKRLDRPSTNGKNGRL